MGDVWEQVWTGIRFDFADLPDATQFTRVVLRCLVAGVLGGLLGYERQRSGKAAGLRTHMLVAVGAALFVLIPALAGAAPADLTRVIQGVVTGVGFLGAGTILKDDERGEVRGLTTAAGIWLTAAVGVAAGLGRLGSAVVIALLALVILALLPHQSDQARK